MKPPQVMGLVFCREFDVATFSMRHLFQGLYYQSFPAVSDPFFVYAALYSGGVEGTVQLTCTRLETEVENYRYTAWRNWPPGTIIQYLVPVPRIRFLAPWTIYVSTPVRRL